MSDLRDKCLAVIHDLQNHVIRNYAHGRLKAADAFAAELDRIERHAEAQGWLRRLPAPRSEVDPSQPTNGMSA